MGSPSIHADLSAKRFGGKPADYLPIHELMDSSKIAFGDLRHRTLTHNTWFVTNILERVFGPTITNSEGNLVSVREIGQWHVMEDYGGSFPSPQDFLENMKFTAWMDNGRRGAIPPSNRGLPKFDKNLLTNPTKVAVKPKGNAEMKGLEPSAIPTSSLEKALAELAVQQPSLPKHSTVRGCGGGGRID